MNMDLIDIVFVVSLSFLALSTIIFLIFFVPVLVQLTRLLESVRSLADLAKDYVYGINNKLHDASDSLHKVGDYVSSLISTLGEGVIDLVFSKK